MDSITLHRPQSLQKSLHHPPMHIRQPEIPPLKSISQLSMTHTQTMQYRRLQVMQMHRTHRLTHSK